MRNDPPALTPFYRLEHPNAPLLLYVGPLAIEQKGKRIECDGEVKFEWLTRPKIRLSVSQTSGSDDLSLCHVRLPESDDDANALLLHVPGAAPARFDVIQQSFNLGQEEQSIAIKGILDEAIVFDANVPLSYVIFHVVNFEETLHQPIQNESLVWLGRATAEFDGWLLTLDTLPKYGETEKLLQAQGGFAITHTARLERADGAEFSVAHAKGVLGSLHWFFGFVRGFWAPPILPVGFDAAGQPVWREWQAIRSTSWRSVRGWLSDRQYVSQSLEAALRGFWKRWNDGIWNDPASKDSPLRLLVHWFVSSNTNAGGIEGSLVLAQTGLELMTWVLLVEDTHTYSATEFDDLKKFSAAKKFEALLQHIGAPAAIPASLSHLTALAARKNWANGPAAIAGYRNTIVHPKRRAANQDVTFLESYQILELALWYLELALLHLCDYNGFYINRTNSRLTGVTERVPWASSAT